MRRVQFHKFETGMVYPQVPPFDPSDSLPEFARVPGARPLSDRPNAIYLALRDLLAGLGLDEARFGTDAWNPLGELVGAGGRVVVKPNLVLHTHVKGDAGVFWIVCHPSLIRALVDYALLAVGPDGLVSIADTPLENCDFERLSVVTGLKSMVASLHGRGIRNLELLDLRTYDTTQYPDGSIATRDLPGDPRGYTDIDLGTDSLLQKLEDECGVQNYYTLGDHTVDHLDPASKAPGMPNVHHGPGRHVYRIGNTVLDSDLVISMAKLKTHKFSGVTLCLKNAIGIGQGKEYLPHRRPGTPSEGGDSFPRYPETDYVARLRLRRRVASLLGGRGAESVRKFVRRFHPAKLPHEIETEPLWGDWHGNDTIWRTTVDLNVILHHARRSGVCMDSVRRAYLGIVDGIIGMDHEGPMPGLPVQSDLLLAARDPVAADLIGTYLMGFDPLRIPTITGTALAPTRALGRCGLAEREVSGNMPLASARCGFVPTKGWSDWLADPPRDFVFTEAQEST